MKRATSRVVAVRTSAALNGRRAPYATIREGSIRLGLTYDDVLLVPKVHAPFALFLVLFIFTICVYYFYLFIWHLFGIYFIIIYYCIGSFIYEEARVDVDVTWTV